MKFKLINRLYKLSVEIEADNVNKLKSHFRKSQYTEAFLKYKSITMGKIYYNPMGDGSISVIWSKDISRLTETAYDKIIKFFDEYSVFPEFDWDNIYDNEFIYNRKRNTVLLITNLK